MTGQLGPIQTPTGAVGIFAGGFLGLLGGIFLCIALPLLDYIVFYPITRYEEWYRGPQPSCIGGICTTSDAFKLARHEDGKLKNVWGISGYSERCRCGHMHQKVGKRWVYIDENYVIHPHLRHIPGGWEKDDAENFVLSTSWAKSPLEQALMDDRISCACLAIGTAVLFGCSAIYTFDWLIKGDQEQIDRWMLLGAATLALLLALIGLICRIWEDCRIKKRQLRLLRRLLSGDLDSKKMLEERIAKLVKKREGQMGEEALQNSGFCAVPISIGILLIGISAVLSGFQNQGTPLERIYLLVGGCGVGMFLLAIGMASWRTAKEENRMMRFKARKALKKEIDEIKREYSAT